MSSEPFQFQDARAVEAERVMWARREARFERGFKWACGALLVVVFGFNAWLVWLIFFK